MLNFCCLLFFCSFIAVSLRLYLYQMISHDQKPLICQSILPNFIMICDINGLFLSLFIRADSKECTLSSCWVMEGISSQSVRWLPFQCKLRPQRMLVKLHEIGPPLVRHFQRNLCWFTPQDTHESPVHVNKYSNIAYHSFRGTLLT